MKNRQMTDVYYGIFAIVFAAVLICFSVTGIAFGDSEYSSSEKRNLQKLPSISISSVAEGRFMDEFEDYMADQFPGRDLWMRLKTGFDRVTGKRESQGVYACSDGYLMERYNGYSPELMDKTAAAVNSFTNKYPDAKAYFMAVPNAFSICSYLLPDNAPGGDQNGDMDLLFSKLSDSIKKVDVREILRLARPDTQVYYRTDHHWTTDGAYRAYLSFCSAAGNAAKNYRPAVVCNDFTGSLVSKSGYGNGTTDTIKVYIPSEEENYVVTYEEERLKKATVYFPEYLDSDDPYQLFFGGNHAHITIETDVINGKKLIVFKDSYANCFLPFLLRDYEQITVIDPRYYYEDIDMLMLQNGFTDILFLYNMNTLSEDNNLFAVIGEDK